ncbi:MAG: hypothetical protein J6S44_04505 [Clostridia bacterium]|nr:hypothetical protein [Clostridia bacterium]
MSHSKMTKRGRSRYVEALHPYAKKFINECRLCGKRGYSPSMEETGFLHPSPDKTNYEHRAIYSALTAILQPLALDDLGRCENCATILDGKKKYQEK